ncbi:M1 family metallopeptidase [Nocardioides sp. Arc9.136]|uniref:M1 family metallopeptidase n=1 Tax=Nocardioides sp. Arc9.136 TaxID=2996826 RepID=UPI002664E8F3|nr:M1 family metallopeptidase [Nocardioides sp. Arc9.136]WKN48324.1 M1 family metallopeptidase [Nocardioides sp. Arc9.136]
MRRLPALLAVALLPLAGCSDDDGRGPTDGPPSPGPSTATDSGSATAVPRRPTGAALDVALSEPREDSVYPDVGDPGVDALHYDLSLTWDPVARVLEGTERVVLRSTGDDDRLRLDLAPELEVGSVRVDGEEARFRHRGKDLVVRHDVVADRRYALVVTYAGTPRPVPAPTRRRDVATTGWTTTADGWTWTMQEPYGAFTWYAVNDHPSDKALYDITVRVPTPFVGVANGALVSREEDGPDTVTRWHLAEPAASYLVTVATGDYVTAEATSDSGVPVTWWVPRDQPDLGRGARTTAEELGWLEERLGPYPFDTLGAVVVDSASAMETQTMMTIGTSEYARSPAVVVHELAHQWYGDQVTPTDWRDVWMNEGMVMYLQVLWQAEEDGTDLDAVLDAYAAAEVRERASAGPPGAYDPDAFGASTVYYGPALMWHELRGRVGEDAFWSMVRGWPASQEDGAADREEYVAWVEQETGLELSAFFDDWLLGETTPARS